MNGSHCTSDELCALIDGSLPRDERTAAVAHMGDCRACASQYRFLMSFERAIRSIPMERTGPGFTGALMAKLDLSLPAPRAFRLFTWIACQIGLLVAAALVGGVFVVTGLIQPDQVEAGKGFAGDILTAFDGAVVWATGLFAGWMRTLVPPVQAGSLAVWSGTALVFLVLVLLDRNFSRRPLHRIR